MGQPAVAFKSAILFVIWCSLIQLGLTQQSSLECAQMGLNRHKQLTKTSALQKAYYEDYNFMVRIRPIYNSSTVYCNAICIEEYLVMSDTTCVKYMDVANIEAKYIQIVVNEGARETIYEVDKIFVNSPDPDDPAQGLTLLHTSKRIDLPLESRRVRRPEKMLYVHADSKVRVVGFTGGLELKENRTSLAIRTIQSKYLCTEPGRVNETPGSQLLKGAPLLRMIDFRTYQLIGILSKVETFIEPATGIKMHQDCYVKLWKHLKWLDEVRSLTSQLSSKDAAPARSESSVIYTTHEDPDVTWRRGA